MLINAKFVENELNNLSQAICYEKDYMYYFERWAPARPITIGSDSEEITLASVQPVPNNKLKILGVFSTYRDCRNISARLSGAISFDRSSAIFGRDLIRWIHHLFVNANIQKFMCDSIADNPAAKRYERLVKSVGGCRCAYYRRDVLLKDGKLHDFVSYEILQEDYFNHCNNVISKHIRDEVENGNIIKTPFDTEYFTQGEEMRICDFSR